MPAALEGRPAFFLHARLYIRKTDAKKGIRKEKEHNPRNINILKGLKFFERLPGGFYKKRL
jgi:hypothetical protein